MQKVDWNAAYYKNNSQIQETGALTVLKSHQFRGDEVILDLGCGDGKITKEIAAFLPASRVVGVDPSSNMIQEARKDFSHLKNVDWVQASGENFNFEFSFDFIFSSFAVQYIEDKLKAFKNIYNSLKPGGEFIFLVPDRGIGGIGVILAKEPWQSMISPAQFERIRITTPAFYQKVILEAGFEVTSIDYNVACYVYKNKEELFRSMYAWVPVFTGFPNDDDNRRFASEIVDLYAQGAEEHITVDLPYICVRAIRLG